MGSSPLPTENESGVRDVRTSKGNVRVRLIVGGLTVMMLLFSGALAIRQLYDRPLRDWELIEQVEQSGGLVGFDNDTPQIIWQLVPRSLREYLPKGNLTAISYWGEKPDDSVLIDPINHFPTIQQINLSNTNVTDAIADSIGSHPRVFIVHLNQTKVTDEGVKAVSRSSSISHLFLDDLSITDAAVKDLMMMPKLFSLSLAGSDVTDACIDDLLKMPQLKFLDITATRITTEGSARLTQSGQIELAPGLSGY